jgi:hypothetical protein
LANGLLLAIADRDRAPKDVPARSLGKSLPIWWVGSTPPRSAGADRRYAHCVTAQQPDDLDFITFVDHAVQRVADEVPGVDAQALHTILLLHRATDVIVYDLESAVHRPAGWSFAGFRMMFVLWLAGTGTRPSR